MATVAFDSEEITSRGDHGHLVTWGSLLTGGDGAPISMIGSAMRTVQVTGNFGGAAVCQIQGSNDGTNWYRLTDSHGNELRFTGTGIAKVMELTRFIRPLIEAGDGTTNIKVSLLLRKEAR